MDLKSKHALVTGASSGMGVEFAKQLAAMGADLTIVARRKDRLDALADQIRAEYKVAVEVVDLDLSEPGSAQALFAATEGAGRAIDLLINNAGGGIHQNFLDIPWERSQRQMQVNVTTLTELCWRFGRAMRSRGSGRILNVSSIGAYTPSPTYATYSAGKAFVRDFSEAIAFELRGSGVHVSALCPGGVITEFHQASGHDLPPIFRSTFMSAQASARIGIASMLAGRPNVVGGLANKIGMWSLRFLPRALIVWLAARSMGTPRPISETSASWTRARHSSASAQADRISRIRPTGSIDAVASTPPIMAPITPTVVSSLPA